MSVRSRLAALLPLLVGALAVGTLSPAAAASADSTIVTSRDYVIAGENFVVSGTLPSPSRQTFALQRYEDKTWSTVATQPSRGPFSFVTSTSTSARYRVVRSATKVYSTTRTIQVVVTTHKLKLDGPAKARVGSSSTMFGRTTPIRPNRTISLQRRLTDGSWSTIDRAIADANGVAPLTWTPTFAGEATLRAVASKFDGAPATISGTRVVTVEEPLPPELPADVSDPRGGGWIELNGQVPENYRFRTDVAGYILDHAVIGTGVTLTVPAGTRIKCVKAYPDPCIKVFGSLRLEGTEQEPVVMTSLQDDEVGGQIGDRVGGPSETYEWIGAEARAGGSITADHVVARYTSMFAAVNGAGSVTVDDSDIIQSNGFLTAKGGAKGTTPVTATVTDTSTVGYIDVEGAASVDVSRSVIKGDATVRVDRNPSRLTLRDSTFTDAPEIVNHSELSSFSGLTLSNDTQITASPLGASAPWTAITPGSKGWWIRVFNDDMPTQKLAWTAKTTYVLPQGLMVPKGTDLTIPAGSVLKAGTHRSIYVTGALTVLGTPADHIVMTHISDTTHGTDVRESNRPEDADPDGRWFGLFVEGGTLVRDFVDEYLVDLG